MIGVCDRLSSAAMRKPVKILLRVLIGVVALLAVAFGLALYFIDVLVKGAVEKGGTAAAGVPVHLESASVELGSSKLDLTGFAIDNPPQFRAEPFVRFGRTHAAWNQSSIFSDAMVIDQIAIDDVTINLEHKDGQTNFGSILDHISARGGSEKKAPSDPNEKKRSLLVKHIVVRTVKAAVHVPGLSESSAGVTVPLIELRDFRSDGSTTELVSALTGTLVDALLTSTLNEGSSKLPKEIAQNLERQVDALKSKAKDVIDEVKGVGDLLKKLK